MAFDVTPAPQSGTAPMRQSIVVQAIPALESPIADRSLTERLASVVTGESTLDLISDGVEHRETFGKVAMTLRRVVQDINKEMVGTYTIWKARTLIKFNLKSLVNSLRELNPEEQAAICTAKLSGNQTFPMLVTQHASEATGVLLGIISGLDEDTRTEVFTAEDDVRTFPMLVARCAPGVTGKLLGMISGLDEGTLAKVFRMRDGSNQTFSMLVLKYAPGDTGALLDIISGLDENTQARVFRARDSGKRTLATLVARRAPGVTGKLLDMISGLDENTQARVFRAKDEYGGTLPIYTAQRTPEAIERLLDMINGLDESTRAKVLTAHMRRGAILIPSKCDRGVPFSMCVTRYAPGVTEKLLDMIGGLDENALEKIFTAHDDARATFSMYVAQYAPETVERLLTMIRSLNLRARVKVLTARTVSTARNTAVKWTFPMYVAQHAPKATGKLLWIINDLDRYVREEIFAVRNKEGWDFSLIMDRHTLGSMGRIWSAVKMIWLRAMSET